MVNILENLNLNNAKELIGNVISDLQNNFLNSDIGNAINSGVDAGIRAIFPDAVENQIINLKNNILNHGLIDGVKESINEVIDIGKNALGVKTNNFESVLQAQDVVSNSGLIEDISDKLDLVFDDLKSSKTINSNVAKTLKKEKNTILNNIKENIDDSFSNQMESMDKLEKYISNWKEKFEEKDFSGMQKEYKKMEKIMESIIPIENTINEFRTIENLQSLIKNNGKNFNLTEEEMELANKLIN